MTSIYYTISTCTPKAQEAFGVRALDFETGLVVSVTGVKSQLCPW
ncbi:hypothetical protein [Photobacterium kishitanii]|nr:hypothetical protein [Photobacterium kishitanii]